MQNAMLVLATQSPADVLRSSIAPTLVEQCATKIFLPNPHASRVDYVDGFGLANREFSWVRREMTSSQRGGRGPGLASGGRLAPGWV